MAVARFEYHERSGPPTWSLAAVDVRAHPRLVLVLGPVAYGSSATNPLKDPTHHDCLRGDAAPS